MSNLYKKLALIILSSFLFLNSLALPLVALAAPIPSKPTPTPAPTTSTSSWYNQNPFNWAAKVYDAKNPSEIFGERYTAAQVQWILYSLIAFPFVTFDSLSPEGPCLLGSLNGGVVEMAVCATGIVNGLIEGINKITSLGIHKEDSKTGIALVLDTSNRSLSAINYISTKLSSFSIISEVRAQEGFGYNAIGLVQNLWQASRNAAYAIVVLITIVFAFMIMFRVKISPQVVISVQSSIPKIFMALILATFSFAIAGLMVDLMYVFTGFMAAILSSAFDSVVPVGSGFTNTYSFIAGTQVSTFLTVFIYMIVYTVMFIILLLFNMVSVLFTWSIFQGILSILFILLALWILILAFVYTVKIPWVLIKALANVYMSVIIAPLQIVFGAIAPQAGFGTWLKNLIANLLVFPVTGIFFYLAFLLLGQAFMVLKDVFIEQNIIVDLWHSLGGAPILDDAIVPGELWSPPLLGSGADISSLIMGIMSFMVIVAIPKVTEIMKMLIMGEKFAFGTAIGEAMGPIRAYGGYAAAELSNQGIPMPLGYLAFKRDAQGNLNPQSLTKFGELLKRFDKAIGGSLNTYLRSSH